MKKVVWYGLMLALLAACASSPSVNPTGEWRLVSYGDSARPTPALPGVETSLKFENGQMGGNVGCNGFGGSYELKGDSIAFGAIMQTEMYCEETWSQEQSVLALLSGGAPLKIRVDGARMTLTSADDASAIVLERK